ncbi:MAG TPA: hypothetical protein GX745_08390, partial [Clostridiales bacterium]|nr:hypothetical protein [Clostridiales bacterium]
RKYLENDDLTAVEQAILKTLILHYENHDKRLGETKVVKKKDLLLYLQTHYKISLTERRLRAIIRRMFVKGIPVGGHSRQAGYYVLDAEEAQHLINEDISRCKHLYEHANAGKKIIADMCGQQRIEGI